MVEGAVARLGSPPELSIVLPAYCEAVSLEQFLPVLKRHAAALTPEYEIIVVDALTPVDDTAAVCVSAGVTHVYRLRGNYYGDAVRTGIGQARGRFVVFMDADGSHNPAHLQALWACRNAFDVVIGSRYVAGGKTENPGILIAMSYAVNLTFRLAFQLSCKDVTNSFRLYNGDSLRGLELTSNNFDIVEEILIKLVAGSRKATVKEVPVTFERRKAGESKRSLLAFAASYLATLARLRRFRADARREARRVSGR